MNHRLRCSAEPWVNESGTTRPVACRCSVSSPIADAVFNAPSISPGSMKPGRFFSSRLTHTPDRQSACSSIRTWIALALGLLLPRRRLAQNAEQVLDVMPCLVRDDVGRREFAGTALTSVEAGL